MAVVVDTSVFIDSILEYDEHRTKMADDLLEIIQNSSLEIAAPFLFKVELAGVLSRKLSSNRVRLIVKDIIYRGGKTYTKSRRSGVRSGNGNRFKSHRRLFYSDCKTNKLNPNNER